MPLSTAKHLSDKTQVIPISLDDFSAFQNPWISFSYNWTDELEIEYPHAWYCRFSNEQLCTDYFKALSEELKGQRMEAILGAGDSKIVAKLAAHSNNKAGNIIRNTAKFLHSVPVESLPIPNLDPLLKMGIYTIGQLTKFSPVELEQQWGKLGKDLCLLAQGNDLHPFSPLKHTDICWNIDFLTDPDILCPISPRVATFYIQQGANYLADTLQSQNKQTGCLLVTTGLENGDLWNQERTLKAPTNSAATLLRQITALLPCKLITSLSVTTTKLQTVATRQLQFFEPDPPEKTANFLATLPRQIKEKLTAGMELPRREKILEMWEAQFL